MNDIRELLKSYLDGELSPEKAQEVERAIDSDPKVRSEFEEIRRISATLREAAVAPKVVGLDSTLMALQRSARPVRNPLRWGPALALAGALSVGLLIVVRSSGPILVNSDEDGPFPIPKSPAPTMSNSGTSLRGEVQSPVVLDKSVVASPPAFSSVLEVQVEDVAAAQRQAENLVAKAGGSVDAVQMDSTSAGGPSATLGLEVPSAQYVDVLASLRELGTVAKESRVGKDYMAPAARLKEDASTGMNHRAGIKLSLTQKPVRAAAAGSVGWLDGTLDSAAGSLVACARALAEVLIYAVVLSPIWLPLAVLVRWIGSRRRLAL